MLRQPLTDPVPARVPFARLAHLRATPSGRRWLDLGSVLVLALAYYVAAKLGLKLAYLDGAVTALWPPVGVGIAALVLLGPRQWPGVVIGDLLVADFSTPLGTVVGQTAGNTLEVLVAAVLLRRLARADVAMDRVRRRVRAGRGVRGRDPGQRVLRDGVAAARRRHPRRRVRRGVADVVAVGLLRRARGHPAAARVGRPAVPRLGRVSCSRARHC